MEGLLFIVEKKATVILVDTSAIIGWHLQAPPETELLTVKEVLEEAKATLTKLKTEAALAGERIRVDEPSKASVKNVVEASAKTGDILSAADIKLLALALDHKDHGVLMTDDYAIQNVASSLGIRYRGVAMPGIKLRFRWRNYCPICRKWYPTTEDECEICGSRLLRKPRKRSLNKNGTE